MTFGALPAALWLAAGATLAGLTGCHGGGGGPGPTDMTVDPNALTVSYRTGVRVPADGTVMMEQAFVDQVSRLDPIAAERCPVSNDAAFQSVADALGGITWTHPVTILKDQSLPPLYEGKLPPPRAPVPAVGNAGADAPAAPTIVRPDLVGYQDNIAIFLSQRHGLLAVRTDGPAPVLSCALKLPGQAKYFFYQGSELVLLVNGLASVNEAALLRFRVNGAGFDFVDAVKLDQQSIQDARLFNQTLVVYTNLLTPIMTTDPSGTGTGTSGTGTSGGSGAGTGGGASASASSGGASSGAAAPVLVPPGGYVSSTGVAVTAINWNTALTVAWHEEFLNDPVVDPFAGQDPVVAASKLAVGDVISTTKSFKPFISASDRYVVVSRDVSRTIFTGTQTETYSYCSASHEGAAHSVTYCSPQYEQRPNPDYHPTTNGDYACNGKTLLDCIQEAAPTVSKYIYVRVGQTCSTYTYHDYVCDQYTNNTVSYPTYANQASTEFVVYRYGDDGDFVKLDQQLYELADPGAGDGATVASLNFTGKPLEVDGTIDSKGDLQFQQGHFYVLTNQGQNVHTLLLVGNSIAELNTLSAPRQRGSGSYSYSGSHSTLFSDTRMMISRAYYDYSAPMGIPTWSDVIMLDLGTPDFPAPLNQFVMPGSSDQLILATDGVLGPGTVAFTYAGVPRNLQKLTLFDRADAHELGNELLGTEFNADMVSSWLGVADDQRIRLDDASQRLFMPYGGYNHAPDGVFNPQAHRLNVTAIANQQLTSEMTFDLAEDIIRTVSTNSAPGQGSALAFGDSSVYALTQTPDSWSLAVIEELATPFAVYRFNDQGDLHARIDRIGARCQISTFSGSLNAFGPDHVGVGPQIPCPESEYPVAVGLAIVFRTSATGWQISADGTQITALDAAAVAERLTHVRNDIYCALDGTVENGAPVPYLDGVPASIACFPFPTQTNAGTGTGVGTAGVGTATAGSASTN
jgi:hypothetical protein